jgi:hypothetical protein
LSLFSQKETNCGYEEFVPIVSADGNKVQPWACSYGVIYSKQVLNPKFIEDFLNLQSYHKDSYDMAIGGLFYFLGLKAYECTPPIIKHIGQNSAQQ